MQEENRKIPRTDAGGTQTFQVSMDDEEPAEMNERQHPLSHEEYQEGVGSLITVKTGFQG